MEDDIFLQLSSLLDGTANPSKPPSSSGLGSSSSPYGAADSTMFSYDNMLVPDVNPKRKATGRKNIVIIDDDFSTLDLMKIYLQRDYDVEVFDNPKNAIFYLNGTIPDLIFIDCYLSVMSTKKVLEIIKTYKELQDTKIVYLAEPSEQAAIEHKLPERVLDIISRPIKRADLQRILDEYLADPEPPTEEEIKSI